MITLTKDTVTTEEINNLADWLKTTPRLTKGPLTETFETEFSEWQGAKHSVMVNSGSSANLIMLYVLKCMNKMKNDKVVVPSLCWATDLAPVIQLGMTPYLCDCNLDDLSVDTAQLERLFKEESPSVLILVSVLGLSPDMDKIVSLCEKYDVILLEDVCESIGSTYKGTKLGNFGLMSSYSFFFGHHISTAEGGMVCTDDDEVHRVLTSIRSHGWNRDWDEEEKAKIEKDYNVSGLNSLYTFYYPGFNLRATDIQAFLGIEQMKKIDSVVSKRSDNFKTYQRLIHNPFWKAKDNDDTRVSNFAYPYIHPEKEKIIEALTKNEIEVRPLLCGSMGKQPFFVDLYGSCDFKNCDTVDQYGIYLPNHPYLTQEEIEKICDVVNTASGENIC